MKKALISLILLAFLLPVRGHCQLGKGSWFGSFSASLGYNHTHYDMTDDYDYKSNLINFSLYDNIGFFIINRLAIGPGLSFSISNDHTSYETSAGTNKDHSTVYSLSFSPFVRYYFAKKDKLAYFVQAYPSIGYGQSIYTTPNDKYTRNTLSYGGGAGVGLVYFILDNIGLETQLGYNFTANKIKEKEDDIKHDSGVSSVGIGVGFSFYF
jgi:hypothetical protein